VVGVERPERDELRQVLQGVVPGDGDRAARPRRHLFDVVQEGVPLRDGEVLVHAAGDGAGPVDLLPRRRQDDLLAVLPHHHTLDRELRELPGHGEDVAHLRVLGEPASAVPVGAEEEVGRQVEEMQRVLWNIWTSA
jgi:hypothetical protein